MNVTFTPRPLNPKLQSGKTGTMNLRFLTAGESHGPALNCIMEGMPAGVPLLAEDVNRQLARRQQGYGRGGRMKIETDQVTFLGGVRHGFTMGSPISMQVPNRDYESWGPVMKPEPVPPYEPDTKKRQPIEVPRPGHADYAGGIKYRTLEDMRNVLERASARETTMRVAAGALARRLLEECGVGIGSHVIEIAEIKAPLHWLKTDWEKPTAKELNQLADVASVRCLDENINRQMEERIDLAQKNGDTVGGVFEVVVDNLPTGLGSYVHWDRKLDGRLAGALMSIHAIKGVEIGLGFEAARRSGSQVHDPYLPGHPLERASNNAGGLEGGVTNGKPLVCRVAMKPISTLMKPLPSVNLKSGEATAAHVERSDYCAVPAAGVVGEAMVALVLADALLEKFGGDTMEELREAVQRHRDYCAEH